MEDEKSKTQKKREAEALKKLGVALIALSEEKLNQLPVPDHLKQAIMSAKNIKSHGATRRQAQFIGKLMRGADHESIADAYEQLQAVNQAKAVEFHQMEQWRERLIQEGKPALTEFIQTYHPQDVQKLRHFIKKAQSDLGSGKNTGAQKALFQYLRLVMT